MILQITLSCAARARDFTLRSCIQGIFVTNLAQLSRPGGSPCLGMFNDVASGQDSILGRFRHAVIRPAPD